MIYLLHMPTNVVIGTSLFQIIFVTAFVTFLHALTNHSVDIVLAMILLVGGTIGVQVGVIVGARLKAEHLRALLACLVLLVSMRLAYGLVVEPDDLFSLQILSSGSFVK